VAEDLTSAIQPAAVKNLHPAVLPAPTPVVLHIQVLVIRQLADAAAVGLTKHHALVNKLRHKDATTCQRLAAEADFIGTLLPVLAAPAVQHQQAAEAQLQPHQVHPAAVHVRLDIIGCLTAADGVCLTAQAVQHQQQLQQPIRIRLLLQLQPNLLLRQLRLPQPNQVPLLHQQVNPHQPLVPNVNY